MLTNSAGAVTDTYEYEAFGNLISKSGTTPNVYLYRGERYDTDLGLYYLRARWYNPVTGRFMTRDPYQGSVYDPASLHRYNYARANPGNFIDPSGRTAAGEYGQLALNTLKNAVKVAAVGFIVKCSIYTLASSVQVLGDNPGWHLESFVPNFQSCVATTTWSELLKLGAFGAGAGLLGEAVGPALDALGEWLDGAEEGAAEAGGVRLYRGVPESHPGYDNAMEGVAEPRGGPAGPEMHNAGDTQSPYTSWTANPQTAQNFATNFNTEPGIVLTNTFDPSELIDSPDLFNEDEVLIEGTVSGASTQSVFPIP